MNNPSNVQPGTVIRATLRPQDLFPCFVEFLQEHGGKDFNPAGLPWPEDDDDWWDSEAAEWLLHEQLFNAMYDIAPEGYLFGAHEGDGSDFGFWALEDETQVMEAHGFDPDEEVVVPDEEKV